MKTETATQALDTSWTELFGAIEPVHGVYAGLAVVALAGVVLLLRMARNWSARRGVHQD